MSSRFLIVSLAAFLCSALVGDAASQAGGSTSELALKVADAQKANMTNLQAYRWRVTTDMQSAGASKAKVVNEIAFDAEGKVKATPVAGEMGEEDKRGLRGRKQDKAMNEMADYMGKALQQSLAYMYMSKGTMVDMFDTATITTENGATKVVGKDVYVKGDEVTMLLDAKTLLTNHLTFKTTMGADVINGDVTYAPLKDGTSRVTKSVIDIPAKQMKMISESSDFVKPEN